MERMLGLRVPRVPALVSSRVKIPTQFSLTPEPPFFQLGQLILENKRVKDGWGEFAVK